MLKAFKNLRFSSVEKFDHLDQESDEDHEIVAIPSEVESNESIYEFISKDSKLT